MEDSRRQSKTLVALLMPALALPPCHEREIIKQIDHINSALSHLTQRHDAIRCFKKFPYLRQNHIDVLNRAIESDREVCNDQQAELTDALQNQAL